MMPQLLTVRVDRPQGRAIRVWIPLLPVALVLAPLLIAAALAGGVACLVYRVRVVPAFGVGWRLLCALPGTRVAIREGHTAVLASIR